MFTEYSTLSFNDRHLGTRSSVRRRALSRTDAITDYNAFFLRAKLLDRVNTIPLNHGSEKTASRYGGAFSMMAKM